MKTSKAFTEEKDTHPTDLHVGTRIRFRRRSIGVSQEKLAEDLGLTFQQVQKYERGANRVSASKLKAIADSLGVPVGYFFEGLPDATAIKGPAATAQGDAIATFMTSAGGMDLAEAASHLGPRALALLVKTAQNLAGMKAAIEADADEVADALAAGGRVTVLPQ